MCLNTLEKQINYKFEMMLSAKVWNKQFLPQVCIFRAQLDIYDEDFLRKQNSFRPLQKGHKNAHVRVGSKIGLFMRPAG